MVYGSDFDADARSSHVALGGAKTRHAAYHIELANLLPDNEFVKFLCWISSRTASARHTSLPVSASYSRDMSNRSRPPDSEPDRKCSRSQCESRAGRR